MTDRPADTTPASDAATRRTTFVRLAVRDSAIYLPATLVQGLGGIAVTAIISKLSTPADYGSYTLGISLSTALAMIAGQWINESLIRLWPEARRRMELQHLYATLARAGGLLTLLVMAASIGILAWWQPGRQEGLYPYLLVSAGTFPLLVAFGTIAAWCRITGRSLWFSAFVIWRVLGGVAIGVLLALGARMGTIGFLWGIAIAWGTVVLGVALSRRQALRSALFGRFFSRDILREAVRYSLPLTGIAVAGLVLSISDRYIIGGLLSTYAVGIYALGYSIAQRGMELVLEPFARAVQPILFRSWVEQGPVETQRLVERLARYYLLMAMPLATGLTAVSRQVVLLLSTPEYLDSASVIGIVSAAMIFYGLARMYEEAFALQKTTLPLFIIYIITSAFNVGVNLAGIPRYGYMVAAWSTLASYILMMLLTGAWAQRVLPLRLFGWWLWKPALASAGMVLAVAALQRWLGTNLWLLVVQVAGGAAVYALLILAFGGISPHELRELLRAGRARLGMR